MMPLRALARTNAIPWRAAAETRSFEPAITVAGDMDFITVSAADARRAGRISRHVRRLGAVKGGGDVFGGAMPPESHFRLPTEWRFAAY